MQLFSYGEAFELPSIDPFCLSVQTYLHCSGCRDFRVYNVSDPTLFAESQLPVLSDGSLTISSVGKILQHLQRRGFDLDKDLSRTQRAQSLAFRSLVEDTLYDALLYNWWFLEENRPLIVKTYGKMMPFYARCRHIYNNQMIYWAEERLSGRYMLNTSAIKQIEKEKHDEQTSLEQLPPSGMDMTKKKKKFHPVETSSPVYKAARNAYKALSTFLGEKEHFFGTVSPTTLDVIVYSHLILHIRPELETQTLKTILEFECPNLLKFLDRFHKRWVGSKANAPTPSIWSHHEQSFDSAWRLRLGLPMDSSVRSQVLTSFKEATNAWWETFNRVLWTGRVQQKMTAVEEQRQQFLKQRNWSILGGLGIFVLFLLRRQILSVSFEDAEEDDFYEEEEDDDEENEDEEDEEEEEE